jgi:hypothetical protein
MGRLPFQARLLAKISTHATASMCGVIPNHWIQFERL